MIRLVPMTEVEYVAFLAWAVPDYAAELARAGNVPTGEGQQAAELQFAEFLPQGLATPGQYLYSLVDARRGIQVGSLWVGVRREEGQRLAALYELLVFPPFRRQGYGLQALQALEDHVRAQGLPAIVLHVFGHNDAARALYQKAGYQVQQDAGSNVNMIKWLAARER
jgi:ribosomal protein S18 acetylase RimI-like enzyme